MNEEEEIRQHRQSVTAAWVLRLIDTHDGYPELLLEPDLRQVLGAMGNGASWQQATRRFDNETKLAMIVAVAAAASWATTQTFRVPSLVGPMIREFRNWFLLEAGRFQWELAGIGGEDAEFLAVLGLPFKA